MKLNRKWINEEFVDLHEVSDKEFVETLTVFGQKVETWERMDAEIKNVVVGKVLSMVRHPNSDHMFICQVDVGQEAPCRSSPVPRMSMRVTWFPLPCTIPGSPAAFTSPRASSEERCPTVCSAPLVSWA